MVCYTSKKNKKAGCSFSKRFAKQLEKDSKGEYAVLLQL